MTQNLWREEMGLDYPPLDGEHKAFLKVVMMAQKAAENGDFDLMDTVFIGCYDYVRHHFTLEEDIMERIRFPAMEEHVAAHQMFIKEISDLRVRYDQAFTEEIKKNILVETAEFLKVWFIGHLLSRDRLLKPYLVRLRNLPPRMNY